MFCWGFVMQTIIHTQGIDWSRCNRESSTARIEQAAAGIDQNIEQLSISLVDINGPRLGGIDKFCQVSVRFANRDRIELEQFDESVQGVICKIAKQLEDLAIQGEDPRMTGTSNAKVAGVPWTKRVGAWIALHLGCH